MDKTFLRLFGSTSFTILLILLQVFSATAATVSDFCNAVASANGNSASITCNAQKTVATIKVTAGKFTIKYLGKRRTVTKTAEAGQTLYNIPASAEINAQQ